MSSNSNKKTMTSVWLDMSSCSLPRGYDPRRVRPIIESALKRSVGSGLGTTSFFAFGDMRQLSNPEIEELHDTGISLRHSLFALRDIMWDLHYWKLENPPPANIMLISLDPSRANDVCPYLPLVPLDLPMNLGEYNVIEAIPSLFSPRELEWDFMLETSILEQDFFSKVTPGEATLCCALCQCRQCFTLTGFRKHIIRQHPSMEVSRPSYPVLKKNFKKHYILPPPPQHDYDRVAPSEDHHVAPSEADNLILSLFRSITTPDKVRAFKAGPNNNTTAVWWDMNTCPLPQGYDPCCVRPTIESALKRSIGSGPVVIFAMGNMYDSNEDVIKDIASSGISIRHSFEFQDILNDMSSWKKCHPPPGNIMLISNDPDADGLSPFLPLNAFGPDQHYDLIQGYKAAVQFHSEFLWDTLMKSKPGIPTTRTNCTDWLCTLCNEHSLTFEDFHTHFSSSTHVYEEKCWFLMRTNPPDVSESESEEEEEDEDEDEDEK